MSTLIQVFLALVLVVFTRKLLYGVKKGSVPHVSSWLPLVGHNLKLRYHARTFLAKCRAKYGTAYSIGYLGKKLYILADDEARFMVKHCDQNMFEARNQIYFLVDSLGEWANAPGKPAVSYNGHEAVKNYFNPLLRKLLPETLKWMRKMVEELPKEVGLEEVCSRAMVESVAEILVGAHLKQDKELIGIMGSYFHDIEKTMRQGLRWMLIPVIGSRIAHKIIQSNTPSIATRKHILDKIAPSLLHRKAMKSPPPAISVAEMMLDDGNAPDTIADTLMILIFLSNYTVAGLCRRVLGDLLAHPQFFSEIRQEQSEIMDAKGSREVTFEQIELMPKLDSALRESMRHRASRPEHFRMASEDVALPNGLIIPKDSLMAVDMASIHFPTKEHEEYQPFRFVGTNTHSSQLTRDFLLFGAGKHACPGRLYATQVIKSFIATLLRSYKIHTKDNPIEFNTYEDVFPDGRLILTPI